MQSSHPKKITPHDLVPLLILVIFIAYFVAYVGLNMSEVRMESASVPVVESSVKRAVAVDSAQPQPTITSISPSSGPVGTIVTLKGTNLAGFEGDLDAVIENSSGQTAFLPGIGEVPRADQTIRVKIADKICTVNTGYSGAPCPSYMAITPGVYNLYTAPWGNESNKVQFTVTK